MLRRVTLVRADVSEELSVYFIRMTRIDELGTTLAVTANRCTSVGSYKCLQPRGPRTTVAVMSVHEPDVVML
jgi:hypothetical protein